MATKTEKSDRELILKAAYNNSSAILYWHQIKHEKLTAMNTLLIGVATLLIPIIGSLALTDKNHYLDELQKITIESIIGILILSIVLGFIQLMHEYAIFSFYNSRNSKRAEAFYDNLDKSWEEAKSIADEFRIKNIDGWLLFPYALVVEAFLVLLALGGIILLVYSFLLR